MNWLFAQVSLLITLAKRLWSIALSHMSQQYGVHLAPLLTLILSSEPV